MIPGKNFQAHTLSCCPSGTKAIAKSQGPAGEKPFRTFLISPMNPLDASEANATTMELQTVKGVFAA
jgi:hypothetical protein